MTDFQDILRGRAAEGDDGRAFQVKVDNGKRRAPPALTIWTRNTLILELAGSRNGGTIATAAAEPLKTEPWMLQVGAVIPPYQTASRFEKHYQVRLRIRIRLRLEIAQPDRSNR